MPRNMSFAMTKAQIVSETKTVTRRDGWLNVKAGDLLRPVNKTMGFKRGEKPTPLLPDGRLIEVIDVFRQPLDAITLDDVTREGFPGMTPAEFITMYRRHGKPTPDGCVTRIEFRYVTVPA